MHHSLFTKEKYQWIIVLCWLLAALMCVIYLPYAGKPFKIENINDPKTESTIAQRTMEKEFDYSGSRIFVLYKGSKLHAYDEQFNAEVNKSLSAVKNISLEHRVISPYSNTRQISKNEKIAYAVIETNIKAEVVANYMDEIKRALGQPKKLELSMGGEACLYS